jgi:hypothetical protein
MRCQLIRLHWVRVALHEPFRISNGVVSERDAILVEIETDGATGWGEAAPMPGSFYSDDTPESTWEFLRRRLIPYFLEHLLHFAQRPVAAWSFALAFGFAMGADYMLIPFVTAECFGTASLGKLLALIIVGYSLGQWGAPWLAGKIFDARQSYTLAWEIMTPAGVLGAAAIYAVSLPANKERI